MSFSRVPALLDPPDGAATVAGLTGGRKPLWTVDILLNIIPDAAGGIMLQFLLLSLHFGSTLSRSVAALSP